MGDFALNEDSELPRFFRRRLLSFVPYLEAQFLWAAEHRDLVGPAPQAQNLSTVIHGQSFPQIIQVLTTRNFIYDLYDVMFNKLKMYFLLFP